MSFTEIGDRLVLSSSIEGNVFPKSEREALFPLTIKPDENSIVIKGSVYARSIDINEGETLVYGPMASRGDIVVRPGSGKFQAQAGITTLGGFVVGEKTLSRDQLVEDLSECRSLIRGDVVSNQSVLLNNTVIFGSVKAVNCTLINSIVLGTVQCQDQLSVEMSSLGGYLCKDIFFKGTCTLFNSLGESTNKPQFLPYEDADNSLVSCSVHLYPAIRSLAGMRITPSIALNSRIGMLYPDVDWISITAEPGLASSEEYPTERWVLSIGGRIADFSQINQSADDLSEMLRVGFEFPHYNVETKTENLNSVLERLTNSEKNILLSVCI